jgi:hypothetical protein
MLLTFLYQVDGVARKFAFVHFVNSHELSNGLFHRIAFLESVDYAGADFIEGKVIFRIQIEKDRIVANFLH